MLMALEVWEEKDLQKRFITPVIKGDVLPEQDLVVKYHGYTTNLILHEIRMHKGKIEVNRED